MDDPLVDGFLVGGRNGHLTDDLSNLVVTLWAKRVANSTGDPEAVWANYRGMIVTAPDIGSLELLDWLDDAPPLPADHQWHMLKRRVRVERRHG